MRKISDEKMEHIKNILSEEEYIFFKDINDKIAVNQLESKETKQVEFDEDAFEKYVLNMNIIDIFRNEGSYVYNFDPEQQDLYASMIDEKNVLIIQMDDELQSIYLGCSKIDEENDYIKFADTTLDFKQANELAKTILNI